MANTSTFSIHSKTIGLLLVLCGLGFAFGMPIAGYENEALYPIYGGMVALGVIIFIAGMLKTAATLTQKNKSMHQDDGAIAAMALMRCMIAICIADHHLDEREIKMIAKIYKQLMHTDLDEDTIRSAAEEMQESETNITEELKNINDMLYDDLRMKILKASLYILVADSDVDEREELMLEKIRAGLGYSKNKLERTKAKFLEERNL